MLKERVKRDIDKFYTNISKIKYRSKAVEMAISYAEDAEYFFKKGDIESAFGAIEYAHGLLDGFLLSI